MLASVLWCVDKVLYPDLKQAVNMHTNLVGATSSSNKSSPTVMDIGAIATVIDGEEQQPHQQRQQHQHMVWSLDETGWPVDESGWRIDGYVDEQSLNSVKGGKRTRERAMLRLWQETAFLAGL